MIKATERRGRGGKAKEGIGTSTEAPTAKGKVKGKK